MVVRLLLHTLVVLAYAISASPVHPSEGTQRLSPEEMTVERHRVFSTDTEYLTAVEGNVCLQIPTVMKTESIFCHGPFRVADFNEFTKPWESGKGSCADRGYGSGPQDKAANVTDQTDMHVCHFTSWDFAHPLPIDQRSSSWYKPVAGEASSTADTPCQSNMCHICTPPKVGSGPGSCCNKTWTCFYDQIFGYDLCLPPYQWICGPGDGANGTAPSSSADPKAAAARFA